MPDLKIYFLETPRILLDDALLTTDRRKAIALLAYLVITGQAHTWEGLATLFWPEYPSNKAFAYLRRTIWELNSVLGEGSLDAGRDQVTWKNRENTWLDVHEFHDLISRCPPSDDSEGH